MTSAKLFTLPASKRATASVSAKSKRRPKNAAGRPTAEELDRRKKLVMEVATALFVERGYAGTSLVDIAQLAGVATRTIYQHFGDKESIFRDVIYARDLDLGVAIPQVSPNDTLFSALRKTSDYAFAVTCNPRAIGLMRLMIAESNRFPDFMQSTASTIMRRFLRIIERVFKDLSAAGLIPVCDFARLAELFSDISLGSHPIMIYTNWDARAPNSDDLDERVELFIRGQFGPEIAATARTKTADFLSSARPGLQSV